MYIIAGNNNFTIIRQNVYRDNGVGLILKIDVARDSITIDKLETIVNDIAFNQCDIKVYDDNNEKIAILSGFHCEPNIIAKGGIYTIEFINASENTFQLGRHKLMIETLEKVAQEEDLKVLLLAEKSVNMLDAIDSILTKVLPTAIEEAVKKITQ